ncbi:MAG: TlpA family protein disulfide reductase [Acidimicrobiales bacterium]|nr:TlpA family protein disulfide reductase [Acidimicrobiales bacterium]
MFRAITGPSLMGLILIVLLATTTGCAEDDPTGLDDVTAMVFELWDGGTTTLDDLVDNGRPLVVNLWATWCTPCLKEIPVLQDAHERGIWVGNDLVRFVGINVSDSPTRAAQQAEDLGITYLQGRDPDGRFSASLSTVGLPVTAFVDHRGELTGVHHGSLDADELAAAIDEYLGTS